jgi:carbonic anhydrase
MLNDVRFELIQFHLHAPAEHVLDSVYYPAEVHLVHKKAGTGGEGEPALELLVLGVFFSGDGPSDSTWLTTLINSDEVARPMTELGSPKYLLPLSGSSIIEGVKSAGYYNYPGSLTSGNCNEIVTWVVSKYIEPATTHQICGAAQPWREKRRGDSTIFEVARPHQPLNGRVVLSGEFVIPPVADP